MQSFKSINVNKTVYFITNTSMFIRVYYYWHFFCRAHEKECDYKPVRCPNNPGCPVMVQKVGIVILSSWWSILYLTFLCYRLLITFIFWYCNTGLFEIFVFCDAKATFLFFRIYLITCRVASMLFAPGINMGKEFYNWLLANYLCSLSTLLEGCIILFFRSDSHLLLSLIF